MSFLPLFFFFMIFFILCGFTQFRSALFVYVQWSCVQRCKTVQVKYRRKTAIIFHPPFVIGSRNSRTLMLLPIIFVITCCNSYRPSLHKLSDIFWNSVAIIILLFELNLYECYFTLLLLSCGDIECNPGPLSTARLELLPVQNDNNTEMTLSNNV